MKRRDILLAVSSLLVIAMCGWFVWKKVFAAPKINLALHQGIGMALAEETIRCLNGKGEILVITMAEGDSDILAAQFAAFRERLGKSGVAIKDVELISSEKSDKYGPGLGLSASKLSRELKKHGKKDAVVSFVGLPKLDEEELLGLGEKVPPLLAFSRNSEKLSPLFKRGLIKAAIVPRFTFPAPGPESPHSPAEWFTNQYQIVNPAPGVARR